MTPGRVVSLNRSNGGVPKRPVDEAWISIQGMEGDHQADRRHHGGPDRALSLYSLELIEQLQLDGHPITPGAVGENVTISGLDWTRMLPGARLALGNVTIELTTFAIPCKTIREAFVDGDFTVISPKVNAGWSRLYARVSSEGLLRVGAAVRILPLDGDWP